MLTVHHEDLREPQVVAVWVGDIATEGDLTDYLGRPFETTFGFFLDQDDLPEFARSFTEPRRHAHYNRPFEKADIRELISGFSWSGEWINEAEHLCRSAGFNSAKTVVVFPNFRYRRELELGGGMVPRSFSTLFSKLGLSGRQEGRLYFVGNVSWSGGAKAWEELQGRRITMPPFPRLIVNVSQHETECAGSRSSTRLLSWGGRVHLESWKEFAGDEEVSPDFEGRFTPWPNGDYSLDVKPPGGRVNPSEEAIRSHPTAAQAKAFQHLLDNQAAMRGAVLEGIFKVYPKWRENYYGEENSSDGGKTYQKGSDLPEMFPPEHMPELKDARELMRLIQPGTIHVLSNEIDGFVRIGFGFSCKWDEEHGLGVLTHQGRVVEVGEAETAFNDA